MNRSQIKALWAALPDDVDFCFCDFESAVERIDGIQDSSPQAPRGVIEAEVENIKITIARLRKTDLGRHLISCMFSEISETDKEEVERLKITIARLRKTSLEQHLISCMHNEVSGTETQAEITRLEAIVCGKVTVKETNGTVKEEVEQLKITIARLSENDFGRHLVSCMFDEISKAKITQLETIISRLCESSPDRCSCDEIKNLKAAIAPERRF